MRKILLIPLLAILALSCGCQQRSALEVIEQRGTLNVATRNGPSTFHAESIGQDGFEFQLAKEFAEHIGVKLNIVSVFGRDDLFRQLDHGKADIAAAGLILNPSKLEQVRFSATYYDTQPRVIYKRGSRRPRTLEDLFGKRILVGADSYHATLLENLERKHPDISWQESYDQETIDMLDLVQNGELDFTVVNEHEFFAYHGIYPQLSAGMQLGDRRKLAWAIPRDEARTASLYTAMDDFMQDISRNGRLQQLQERYFSYFEDLNQADALEFAGNIRKRLPIYEKLIRSVATEHGMAWELLAAMSYQESHWNPHAVSPTGVRGMMMLTRATAQQVNIKDRDNLEQSLRGGAEYFLQVLNRIPEDIAEPDRTWFALATYNVGYGHLEDARKLTEAQGFDPHLWLDVKRHLPLLRKRAWYSRTRYGYARGDEPVRYVQNIRHYFQVLRMHDIARNRQRPPVEMSHRAPVIIARSMPAI